LFIEEHSNFYKIKRDYVIKFFEAHKGIHLQNNFYSIKSIGYGIFLLLNLGFLNFFNF